MIYIAGGSFDGRDIAPFYLDETEVTVAAFREWERASSWTGCGVSDEALRGDVPVEVVWDRVEAYCEWRGARVPTEWEWEWAARGREEARKFPWGSEDPSCAHAIVEFGCGTDEPWPVGSRPAGDSRDGLKDMAGNADEWTSGVGEDGNEIGVLRGGSYRSGAELIVFTQTSSRFPVPSGEALGGIRCARSR
ncbi:formylglycine-generating enzyme family protein [Enhygromyxa salina]|uniref:formylglycine-generating enzyme family protein n=1 Tax=Enhygromyxa salina TaxID=215803 RepID=UPI0026A0D33E